jgi:hypothetical protein
MVSSTSVAGREQMPRGRAKAPGPNARALAKIEERRIERRIGLIWTLLFINIMSYARSLSAIPIPSSVGKGLVQLMLPIALLLALTINGRLSIRPNVYLCLVSLFAIEAVFTLIGAELPKGMMLRVFRLVGFVVALWLLTPYWGREKMILVRWHVKILFGIACSAIIGIALSPSIALGGGRLVGTIGSIPATQLAHYTAVAIGISVILGLCGLMRGRAVALIAGVCVVVLLLTHTRTAMLALVAGLLVAVISLVPSTPRARKALLITAGLAVVVYITAAGIIMSWLTRGQSAAQLNNLTGRTNFWGPLLAYPRSKYEMLFGFGLSNGTFRGLPIDSNWLDSYQDQGLFGDTVCVLILLSLLVALIFQTRGVYRAIGLFLVIYCIIASFTEDGITNASSYLLDCTVAASLLVPSIAAKRPIRRTHLPPLVTSS